MRYASAVVGSHRFKTESSDAGLNGVEGVVEVEAYKGETSLYLHGPLRVDQSKRYLEHPDGTPFFWMGDTWWMGLSKRLEWPGEFKTLAADRKKKGFNVVQIVAGLYPDMPAFDQRGANEAWVSVGEGLSPGFSRNISMRRISGSCIWPSRDSCRASSGRGDITCRGWGRKRCGSTSAMCMPAGALPDGMVRGRRIESAVLPQPGFSQ